MLWFYIQMKALSQLMQSPSRITKDRYMANQNQTPNTVEEEIDIDKLIEDVVVNNYDKSFVPKIHQAMLSELRRIKFNPDSLFESRLHELVNLLCTGQCEDFATVYYIAHSAITTDDLDVAQELVEELQRNLPKLPKEARNMVDRLDFEVSYRSASASGAYQTVLNTATLISPESFEKDPTLYVPIIDAHLSLAREATNPRTRKRRIKKAMDIFAAYNKIADPGSEQRLDMVYELDALGDEENAYLLLLENLNKVPTVALRIEAAFELWTFYCGLDPKQKVSKVFADTFTPYERLLWLEQNKLSKKVKKLAFVTEAKQCLGDNINVLESNILNSMLSLNKDFDELSLAADAHAKRFPFDPIQYVWHSIAAEGLGDLTRAQTIMEEAIELCIREGVDSIDAGPLLSQACDVMNTICQQTHTIKPFDDFIRRLPEEWRTPDVYLEKIETLFDITPETLTKTQRKQFKQTFAKIPKYAHGIEYELSQIKFMFKCGEIDKARDQINKLLGKVADNPACDPEIAAEVALIAEQMEIMNDPSPLVRQTFTEQGLHRVLTPENFEAFVDNVTAYVKDHKSDDMPPPESANLAEFTILKGTGATVHRLYDVGGFATAAVFTTPLMPKGIAYLMTIDLVDKYKAAGKKAKDELCEVGIPIPLEEAKNLKHKDWRLQLLIYTLENIKRSGLLPTQTFYSKNDSGEKLPFCDYTALIIARTKQPILPDHCPINVGEIVPLYDEEIHYAESHSEDELLVKLNAVNYYPPKKGRQNVCEGQHWKPLIPKEKLKPLYQGKDKTLCQIDPRIIFEGQDVKIFFRLEPEDQENSGWVFLSEMETRDEDGHCVYEPLNTLLNYCPYVAPYLDAPIGSVFIRHPDGRIEAKDDIDIQQSNRS